MPSRFLRGIFGHFFLRAIVIQGALGIAILAVVLILFSYLSGKMAEEQGRTFSNSTLAATIDSIYKNEYGNVIDYCMGIMKNTPNINFIIYSKKDGTELLIKPSGWTIEDKTLGYYALPFENEADAFKSPFVLEDSGNLFNPASSYVFSRPIVIGGQRWGVMSVGFSKKAYFASILNFNISVTVIGVVAGLISLYLFFFSTRRLRTQLRELEEVARCLSEGQLTAKASEVSIGEIGVLGASINAMSLALQDKSDRLKQLVRMVEETDDAFVLFDSTLHVLFVNTALSTLTGRPESDFLGLYLTEFITTLNQNPKDDQWVSHGKPLPQGRDIVIPRLNLPSVHVAMRLESVSSQKEGGSYLLIVLSDITDRKRAEEKLQLAANVFSHAREGIMITEPDGTIIDVNDTLIQDSGYSREELMGSNPRIFKSGRQNRDFYSSMWIDLVRDGYWHGEIWNRRKDGEIYPELKTISAVRDDKGIIRQYVSLSSDITLQKEHENQLVHVANHDNLTGLPNRALLTDRLNQALAQARRDKGMLVLMFLDLDKFKPVNDDYGHEIGDMLLLEVANRIQDCLKRDADTVSRIGGDEFVILLPHVDSESDATTVADKVIAALNQPFYIEQHIINISSSIGVAIYPIHGANLHILMKNADTAMYDAKASGRGCFRFYSEHVIKQQTDATLRADADV
jgi:diguanylate cyclase (GGDEF)-like protein/PAS domain S-box-containing protein